MSPANLENRLTELQALTTAELRARYAEAFKRPPPPRLGRDLLLRVQAYHLQSDALGALSRRAQKALKLPRNSSSKSTRVLQPGLQLIREWQGDTHIVDVLESGYRWRGERFQSLSAIARQITKTRWSGPRFFGLTDS